MPKPKFNLKSPRLKDPTLIIMIFNFNYYEVDKFGQKKYRFLKFSTGEKIEPSKWDNETCRPKAELLKLDASRSPIHPEYWELNHFLDEVESAIMDIYRRMVNDRAEITPDLLKTKLEEQEELFQTRKTIKPKKFRTDQIKYYNFIDFAESYIKDLKFVYKGNIPTQVSYRTKQKYKTTIKRIKQFQTDTGYQVNFDTLNLDFYSKLLAYLQDNNKLSNNTIGKYIAHIKTLCRIAEESGISVNNSYKNRRFAVLEEDIEQVYLTIEELEAISELDLSGKPGLDRVRDLFIVGAFTGLRYSDFTRIKPSNIVELNGKMFIEIITFKTGTKVKIPIHPMVRKVLDKYNNELPKAISNQKMNEYLKIIGKDAEISSPISLSRTKGGKKITITNPKFKHISTHTARRSAATNMYLNGMEPLYIMKITGHKTEKEFMRYIRMDADDVASKLAEHAFFNNTPKMKLA